MSVRPPRPPLGAKPPAGVVAMQAFQALRSGRPELAALAAFALADPEVADWIRRLEAMRRYDMLRAADVGAVEARHRAARHVGVHERSLRRWGVTDD